MADLVCIDTQLLIWGVQGKANVGQEEMILRTRTLLRDLTSAKMRVMVPSVAFAEFLIRCTDEERVKYEAIISRRFYVAAFDFRASLKFGQVAMKKWDAMMKGEIASGARPSRVELKADLMIIATALVQGAQKIYGHENKFRGYTEGFPIEFVNIDELASVQHHLEDQHRVLPEN